MAERLAAKLNALLLPPRRRRAQRRHALLWPLPLRAVPVRLRHHAIAPHRPPPATQAEVPAPEEAVVGAEAALHRRAAADRGARRPRHRPPLLLLHRLRTHPPAAGRTDQIGRFLQNGSASRSLFFHRAFRKKSSPHSRPPRRDRRRHPPTSHTSPVPIFSRRA